jgi:hypothetical protein
MAAVINDTFWTKTGDTDPAIEVTLRDSSGVVINLTSAASVQFIMREKGQSRRTPAKVNAPAVINAAPTTGKVSYSWAAADVDTAGTFDAEWEITWNNGKIRTVPRGDDEYTRIVISSDLGNAI